ncbi:MAG TPA: tetratricopeptide repeat protein [Usitatibacter sp.]
MSLLLDALKRAEQEKLAKQGDRPEPDRTRAVSAPPANESAVPTLELAPIKPAAPASGTVPPARGDAAGAAAAQNMFQAKAPAASEGSRKGVWLWVGLAVLVLVVGTAGVYTWLTVTAFTPRVASSARPRPTPISPAPSSADALPKLEVLMPPPQQPTEAIQPPPAPEPSSAVPAGRSARGEALAKLMRESAAPSAAPPMRLAPSTEKPRVPPEVAAGYAALRIGDVALARRSYAAAIAADPANVDAQLGAATIEARSGNRMLAASHYRKALDVDPRNGTALAGLASLADYSQPEGLESQLRANIARDDRSPQLHYTLGNLYASQSRWNEAQAEYFEAHRLDPANPDILYNLAVSLDHLRQTRLAADYYRRALDAAQGAATQFDPGPVARRLAELR